MDPIERCLTVALFPEKCPPPLLGANDTKELQDEFWSDAHSYNLCAEHVEVEMRFGRVEPGRFHPGVTKAQFGAVMDGLQSYQHWDERSTERSVVSHFDRRDASLRMVCGADGKRIYVSKRKAHTSDFRIASAPFDARIAVSLELPVADTPPATSCTRRVVRDRSSFSLSNWRYDLTRVTHEKGQPDEYHIEIELIDPVHCQSAYPNASELAKELQQRVLDLVRVVEKDAVGLQFEHVRQRWH